MSFRNFRFPVVLSKEENDMSTSESSEAQEDTEQAMDTRMLENGTREDTDKHSIPRENFELSHVFRPCSIQEAQQAIEETVSELLRETSIFNTRVEIVCDVQIILQFPRYRTGGSSGSQAHGSRNPIRGARLMIKKTTDPDRYRRLRITKSTTSRRHSYQIPRRSTIQIRNPFQSRKRFRTRDDMAVSGRGSSSTFSRNDDCEEELEKQSEELRNMHIHEG